MDISHITSHSLRRLLSLTDKKKELLQGLEEVETELAKAIKGVASTALAAVEVIVPTKSKKPSRGPKGKSATEGGLKDRILALLEAAGNEGLRVKEIAEKLGIQATKVSAWFSTTGKKFSSKASTGRYTSKSNSAKSASKTPAKSPARAAKTTKRKMSPEGRARISAAARTRWAAHRLAKASAKSSKAGRKSKV